MLRRSPLLALPVCAVALAACGGGGGSGGKQAASSSPCPSSAVVIHMANLRFAPDKATAKVGQTVCWVNDDDVQHDVAAGGKQFESALYGKGRTFSWKAAKTGTIAYVCTVHPGMDAELDVTG
jgi:plastocyanin